MNKSFYLALIIKDHMVIKILNKEFAVPFSSAGYAGMSPIYNSLDELRNDYPNAEFIKISCDIEDEKEANKCQ